MAKRSGHDFAMRALGAIEQTIGEHWDGSPLPVAKSPVKSKAGAKGGKKRARRLSAKKLSAIGRKGARARWKS